MKVYDTTNIRNIALVGHGDAGKTTLASALLYASETTQTLGSVPDGTAVTDFDVSEIERKVSMSMAVAAAEWRDMKINLIDAPGYPSYVGDAAAAMRAADAVLIVVHGIDGIGVQTERMWEDAESIGLPAMFVVTQLDRERADFARVASMLGERFGRHVIPVSLPIGREAGLEGIVRLATGKAYRASAGSPKAEVGDAPAEMTDVFSAAQEQLFDLITESDDALMEAFLEQGKLSPEQLNAGLRTAISSRALFPVFAASGVTLAGVHALLDGIVDYAPSPSDHAPVAAKDDDGQDVELTAVSGGPLAAQVIKTFIDPFAGRISVIRIFSGSVNADQSVWNVTSGSSEKLSNLSAPLGKEGHKIPEAHAGDVVTVTKLKTTLTGHTLAADKAHKLIVPPIPFPLPVIAYAVKATEGDDEKVAAALQRLAEEDSAMRLERDPRTHELMLSGLGVEHVKAVLEKMTKRYNVAAALEKPKVPYLETITKKSQSMYRHKKQTGGAGQFAEVHMRVEPLPRGGGFDYGSEIFGGSISRNYWPSIEKGVKQILEQGAIAGYPIVDIKAVIFDGKEHPVDSKDIAFQIAGRQVFKDAISKAGPVVLEPIMKVVVTCPDENMGDILGDLSRRRGKVQGSESQTGRSIVRAEVPMAEMLEYAATLKSLTSGAGSYTMSLDHYERVPSDVQQKLMAEFKPQETED